MAKERVQKILAQAGIASRRQAEELIKLGEVTVNGKRAKLGDQAEWGKDAIKVSGKLIQRAETLLYLAFHKPRLVITALSDPQGRPTIRDYFSKIKTRIYPVGRLDFMSDGLLLLTNDGAFAEKLQKSDRIPRVYHVKVKGHPDREMLQRIEKGAKIGEENPKLVKPLSVRVHQPLTSKAFVEVVMMGAGAFDLKQLFELRGFLVEKITRTAIGHITLKGLKPGQYRFLKASQAFALLEQPELGMKLIDRDREKGEERERRSRSHTDQSEAQVKVLPVKKTKRASAAVKIITVSSSKTKGGPRSRDRDRKPSASPKISPVKSPSRRR